MRLEDHKLAMLEQFANRIEELEARAAGLQIALDTIYDWCKENGIDIDISQPIPKMTNTRAAELEEKYQVMLGAREIIDEQKARIAELEQYASDTDFDRNDMARQIKDAEARAAELERELRLAVEWLDEVTNPDHEELRTEEGMAARKEIMKALGE